MKTMSIAFFTRKERINEGNEIPVFMRITIEGKRAEFSIKEKIEEDKWLNGRAAGNSIKSKNLNDLLDSYTAKAKEYYRFLYDKNESVTALKVADLMKGKNVSDKTLLWLCDKYISKISNLIDNGYADATLTRYQTTKRHIEAFLKKKYRRNDILITDLNYEFISEFENYFKRTRKCNHNTSMKYLKNLKAIVNLALKNDWLDKDPFRQFTCKIQPVERDFLTEEEVLKIKNKKIIVERLGIVRDAFVLACFTGLSYIDIKQLRKQNIITGVDGEQWIYANREKTNIISKIPLLPEADKIIKKYSSYSHLRETGYIIPVPSNQKVNAYLKEIADLAEITKNLTFHVARHRENFYQLLVNRLRAISFSIGNDLETSLVLRSA
ncbi:site-specific integrase [Dysgonomonas capnocytophagoides]|uniref:site-specific integrase n=1 Tax=Dysgonomonas capnocytophagoides TaxID=45254 RepID=UPI00333F55E0